MSYLSAKIESLFNAADSYVNSVIPANERFRYCAWLSDTSISLEKRNKILAVVSYTDTIWQEYLIRKQQIISESNNIEDIRSQYMLSMDISGQTHVYSYTVVNDNIVIGDMNDNIVIPEYNSVNVNTDFSSFGNPPFSFLDILNTN